MTITIIGFDIWGYGKEIAHFLEKKGYQVNYINTSLYQYQHKNLYFKIHNFISKVFFYKNLKKYKRDQEVVEILKSLGALGKVFVINPGEYHDFLLNYLKKNSNLLVGWNYDSMKRKALTPYHFETFDQIYSFDRMDCEKEKNLTLQTNYIMGERQVYKTSPFKYKSYCVMAYDSYRCTILENIFKAIGDPTSLAHLKFNKSLPKVTTSSYIHFIADALSFQEVDDYLMESEIFIDILRKDKYNQVGLSFRVFDALRFQRKLITTNKDIIHYDFYNPNNIYVIKDVDHIEIPQSFLETPYIPLAESIYKKYTLETFCINTLELKELIL